ncbi:MAG: helix-turn-helix domain-containing protein [Prevotella sp.]
MRLKNEIFATVLDRLIREHYVIDQRDLSHKTGITATTISRIMTGKVEPKDETLRKLNAAFGNMFNMQYLRGQSNTMLVADQEEATSLHEDDKTPYTTLPKWADTLIEIMSKQIKENEALNQELRQSISDVDALRTDLQKLIEKITQKS